MMDDRITEIARVAEVQWLVHEIETKLSWLTPGRGDAGRALKRMADLALSSPAGTEERDGSITWMRLQRDNAIKAFDDLVSAIDKLPDFIRELPGFEEVEKLYQAALLDDEDDPAAPALETGGEKRECAQGREARELVDGLGLSLVGGDQDNDAQADASGEDALDDIAAIIRGHVEGPNRQIALSRIAALREREEKGRDAAIEEFRADELDAVMHSVDKWFDEGDPRLKNNPATRAADAREIALRAIESAEARAALGKEGE